MTEKIPPELKKSERITIVGIGNRNRGDDSVGIKIIEKLEREIDKENVVLINAENIPEKFTSKIKKSKPEFILLIDSIRANIKPGKVKVAKAEDILSDSISTHKLPLSKLINYLEEETGATVRLLGIQAKKIKPDEELSKEIKETKEEITEKIIQRLN